MDYVYPDNKLLNKHHMGIKCVKSVEVCTPTVSSGQLHNDILLGRDYMIAGYHSIWECNLMENVCVITIL